MGSTSDVLIFYGWWQLGVCLFAFIGLIAIWWHIGRRQGDTGQVWLALSILSWSFSGLVEVIFGFQKGTAESEVLADGFRSIFSLFNSLFILLSLPWFRYLPQVLKPIILSRYWIYIVGLPFLFSLLPTLRRMVFFQGSGFITELDVYYSVLTLVFLGYVLWESFAKRRLKALAWLSIFCIITTFIAQAYKLTDSEINLILFSAIFKTCLIMIFFALALSWVKELAENIIPSSSALSLGFNRQLVGNKIINLVHITGIPGRTDPVKLSPHAFELLLTFGKKKLAGDQWLEIKPKHESRSNRQYDIKDHNEIRRMVVGLLEGLFGKDNWTREQHEIPLKSSLFEMSESRERKIRLALRQENISIGTELVASNPK